MNILRRQGDFCPLSRHRSCVPIDIVNEATRTLRAYDIDQVTPLTTEEGDRSINAIPKAEVNAPVQLVHLLVGEVVVSWLIDVQPGLDQVGIAQEGFQGEQTSI